MTPADFFDLTLPQYNMMEESLAKANEHESNLARMQAL